MVKSFDEEVTLKMLEVKKMVAGEHIQVFVGMIESEGENKSEKPLPQKVSSIVSQVPAAHVSTKVPKFVENVKKKKKVENQDEEMKLGSELKRKVRIKSGQLQAHSHKLVDKRGKKPKDRGKPYGRGNQKTSDWKKPSEGDSSALVRCYRCDEAGHRRHECKSEEKKCFKCGKAVHVANDCRGKIVTCYNCGEEGHISPQCTKPRKNQSGGKVFSLSGSETTLED
ncbi:uncharacterized protein LOC131648755 [Vicia villosa]|uniref:uncharacterized protein LOC131648755 n=1 Tax=Vicia villosa TaxID=3911 RepID=UPI00273BE2FF|nr:uncharacterized protein LOC131648755 [Vicia villosa]